jgi:DNA-binding transcriptional ArsR family regulator
VSEHPGSPEVDASGAIRWRGGPRDAEAVAGSEDLVFRALSDPTRRRILLALAAQDLPAGQVAAMFPISGPSVSRHLTVLRSAGLVNERREGNRLICSLVAAPLAATIGRLVEELGLEPAYTGTGGSTGPGRSTGTGSAGAEGSGDARGKKKPKTAEEVVKKKNKKDKRRAARASAVPPEPVPGTVLPGTVPGPKLT